MFGEKERKVMTFLEIVKANHKLLLIRVHYKWNGSKKKNLKEISFS